MRTLARPLGGDVPHQLDIGKKRFRALVNSATETKPRLPLVHSTDSYVLEEILENAIVEPQDCPVFGEALTYFFYGRPAFRPNADAEPTGLKHYFPVCLIFKLGWATSIKRVFPFDTGAFQNSFYTSYLHKKMKLGDFGLEADLSTPGKVISQFFGSVPQYLTGRPKPPPGFDPSEFEAQSYLALIHARDGNAIDSRGSGIEVQTDDTINVADAVAAAILPSTFVDGVTGTKLKAMGIDVLPYRTIERSRPSDYMSGMTSLCFDYYVRIGLIAETDLKE